MESIPYDAVFCPHCGYNEETVQPAPYLEPGTLIMRKYLVGRVTGISPDSITYIGANIETGLTIDVVEFFPHSIVTRGEGQTEPVIESGYENLFASSLQSFIKLWRGLDIFKDANCLPNVLDIVDFNGTVYAVSEHKDCISLRESLGNDIPLAWQRALSAFKPLMYALKKLNYAGIIHGALSPDTVLVSADGKLHITGFSIPQCNSGLAEFSSKPAEGFAPIELYDTSGAGAETDIYSITALLYYSITLITPPEATLRVIKDTTTLPAAIANTLSRGAIDGLIRGLSVQPENRFSNFDELLNALAPVSSVRPEKAPHPPVNPAPAPESAVQSPDKKPMSQKEEIDLEIRKEAEMKKELRKERREATASVSVGIKSFLAGFILCAIICVTLYGTVLYKNYPVDFMDIMLKPFSFLPLNKEPETTVPTTEITEPTKINYITVADFVNNHTYDSIVSNQFFTENYDFTFTWQESTEHPKGVIISQDVTPGESVAAKVKITLTVSEGTTKIKLPDVTGVNYIIASETLKTAGFRVEFKLLPNDGKHTVGEVFSMNKKAGELYENGTVITLNVWNKVVVTTTAPTTTAPTTPPSTSATQTTTAAPTETTTQATTAAQ